MSIERIEPGPRMTMAVVHGDTVYTAGQVAREKAGGIRHRADAGNPADHR